MQRKFESILQCPTCRQSGLIRESNSYICKSCGIEYPDYEGVATLVAPEDRKKNYRKLLVLKDNTEFWTKEAKWDKRFADLVPDGDGILLDFACGGGRKRWSESKGYEYIGLDYYLDYGVNLLANGKNIPLKGNTISICTSNAVIEHIPDPWKACSEVFRVLKPGGKYIGSTAFLQTFHERSHYHMTHLGVRYMLEKSGFIVEKIIPFRRSGFEALARNLFIVKQPISYLIRLLFPFIMFLRKTGAGFIKIFYSKDTEKMERISQFIAEEPMRFTSGFIYVGCKPD